LRLVYAVKLYWISRGLLGLGYRVTVEALSRAAHEPSSARCRALFGAGQLACFMGRYAEARRYLEESLTIARDIGDRRRIAAVLQPLGVASLAQGDAATARGYAAEALEMARELGNKRELATALNVLAAIHRVEGRLDVAEPLYENVVALARELGDRESIAIGLLNLAMASIGRGSSDRARELLLEALAIAEEIGSKQTGQSVLEVSAGLAALRKEWRHAARFYGAAEAQAEQTGLRRDPADEAFLLPLVANARAALNEVDFAEADAAGRALPYGSTLVEARAWLARGH